MDDLREYKIDGHPVTKKEVLEQAELIVGTPVFSMSTAKNVLSKDGREVTKTTER